MRPRGALRAVLAALMPAACLLALWATGAARPLPTLLALAATAAAGFVLGARRPPPPMADRSARAEAAAADDLLESLPDPLLLLDDARGVRRANEAAASLGGQLGAVLRHPGLRLALERALSDAGDGRASAELVLPVPVPRELRARIVRLPPGRTDGASLLVQLADHTKERAVERMRADFVANVSHELRTPLASLVGFIQTLQGPAADDPPAQLRFLAIMAEQAARMGRLIEGLLELSRIELSEHQPPTATVELAGLLAREAAAFEPRLAEAGITLARPRDAALPPVAGDADQLAQVVHNLLDNAVRHGRPGGTIELSAAPARGGPWPDLPGVALRVADDGPGIPATHLPRLTERFYRVDPGRARAGGSGLGLAIVKHIVSRHRGRLLIESEPGRGTTASVWLPCAGTGETPPAG